MGSSHGHNLYLELLGAHRREDALRTWARLEAKVTTVPLAASRKWVDAWLDSYGDLIPHSFAFGYRDGVVCGAVLLTKGVDQWNGPLRVRTVHLGTSGESDEDSVCVQYNDVLALAADREEFLRRVFALVEAERKWDELRVDGFAADTLLPLLGHGLSAEVRTITNHYYDLAGARARNGDLMALLSRKARKQIRRTLALYEHIEVEWAEDIDTARSIFEDLVTLHGERWSREGEPGAYRSVRFSRFHRRLLDDTFRDGTTALFRVRADGQLIGCLHMFVDRNRVLSYQSGLKLIRGRNVGMVVDYLCLEQALRRGYDAYDFLAGDTEYKRRLSTHSSHIVWATQRRPNFKHLALEAGRVARQLWHRREGLVRRARTAPGFSTLAGHYRRATTAAPAERVPRRRPRTGRGSG